MPPDIDLKEALSASTQPSRRNLAEDVADRVRDAIVLGKVEPGQRLSEPVLAETFNVSRGPIREAFAILESEGLLQIERHKGAYVTRLSRDDIEEIYSLRTSIERLAIERAAKFGKPEDFAAMDEIIAKLEEVVKHGDSRGAVELDVAFHDLIYRASGHSRLYRVWSSLRPQIETFLYSRASDTQNYMLKVVPEHRELLQQLRDRDAERAVANIDEHIRVAYDRLRSLSFPEPNNG